ANPSDYDAVILNLAAIIDPGTVVWDDFFRLFTELTTLEIIGNGGCIIIVGDPRFCCDEPVHVPGSDGYPGRLFLSWTGIQFDWIDKPGKTKQRMGRDERYTNYVHRISHWNYSLRSCKGPRDLLENLTYVLDRHATKFSSKVNIQEILKSRSQGQIVFAIILSIAERIDIGMGEHTLKNLSEGQIIFLPQIDEPQEQIVAMVLSDILGIQVLGPEPSWASTVVAPGQAGIDARIAQIKNDLEALQVGLKNAEKGRERARRCVHLLYKLGDELEDVVREVLG